MVQTKNDTRCRQDFMNLISFNEVHCPHLYMYALSRERFIKFFFLKLTECQF